MAPQSKRRHQLSQPTRGTERKPPGQIGIIPTIGITQPIHIGGIDPIITRVIQAIGPIHRIGRIPTTTLTATDGKPTAAAAAAYLRAAAAGVALVISDDAGALLLTFNVAILFAIPLFGDNPYARD
jgi:predicted naringenin-chalcone synthase